MTFNQSTFNIFRFELNFNIPILMNSVVVVIFIQKCHIALFALGKLELKYVKTVDKF